MIYFSIFFLCTAGLFLSLLEDRFRLWTTLGVTAGTYLLSLGAAYALRRVLQDPVWAEQVPCAAGCLLFFIASLFLFRNNPLQKFFIALLSLCDFAFLGFFVPLLLGTLPFSPAGAFGGGFSVLACCLFTLLLGLCLYRPFHHFSDRGTSGFLFGMCLIFFGLYALCLGKADFLFRAHIPAARLLVATLTYCGAVFAFRSLYQAGRFREKAVREAARERVLSRGAESLDGIAAAVREARSAQRAGEYALDTISVLLADGYGDKIPSYIPMAKRNAAKNPFLTQYHADPRLNALIASKAAFAAQNNIAFECNAVTSGSSLKPEEIYEIAGEMLGRACRDAAAYPGPRKVRFTIFPTASSLRFEAVYSAELPQEEKFTLRGKNLSQTLTWLLEDSPQGGDGLRGLEGAEETVSRYSGKLTVSGSPGETVLFLDARS